MSSSRNTEHPLQNTWVFFEHQKVNKQEDYKNSMRRVVEFSTVEEFWKNWVHIPKPSTIFSDGHTRKEVSGRVIDAFSVFKKDILPEWDEPANKQGCELTSKKPIFDVDVLWENLVLGVIGEVIEDNDEICGCRVVEKIKKGQKPYFRLELWLKHCSQEVAERVKSKLLEALQDNSEGGKVRNAALEFDLKFR